MLTTQKASVNIRCVTKWKFDQLHEQEPIQTFVMFHTLFNFSDQMFTEPHCPTHSYLWAAQCKHRHPLLSLDSSVRGFVCYWAVITHLLSASSSPGQGSRCHPPRRCWTDLLDSEPQCRGSPRWLLLQKDKPHHSISTSNNNTLRCKSTVSVGLHHPSSKWEWRTWEAALLEQSNTLLLRLVKNITNHTTAKGRISECLWRAGWHLSVGWMIQRARNKDVYYRVKAPLCVYWFI